MDKQKGKKLFLFLPKQVAINLSPLARNVSRTSLQLSQLAINLSQNQNQSCNEREPDKPMIASQGSYDCKPLQLSAYRMALRDMESVELKWSVVWVAFMIFQVVA